MYNGNRSNEAIARRQLYWSLFDLIRPFISDTESSRLRAKIYVGNRVQVFETLLSEEPRHCIECLREAKMAKVAVSSSTTAFAQLYWCTRCCSHGCALSDGRSLTAEDFPGELLARAATLSRSDLKLLNAIQRATEWVAHAKLPPLHARRWLDYERRTLHSTYGIEWPYLGRDLLRVAEAPSSALRKLLRLYVNSAGDNWVSRVVRSTPPSNHPLYHIALIALCGRSLQEAVDHIFHARVSDHAKGRATCQARLLLS